MSGSTTILFPVAHHTLFLLLALLCHTATAAVPCLNGSADVYPCRKVNLLAMVPNSAFGAFEANDIWGWTDPETGTEYVLLGLSNGIAFLSLLDPGNPVYVGLLPGRSNLATHRDVKVYRDYAYAVSETPFEGMQIFDLTRLRTVASPPVTFSSDGIYTRFFEAHNIVINGASGRAYAVGGDTCGGGLHAMDLGDPVAPAFEGCFSLDGYTHDAQCVTYAGPDPDYQGREICVALNEDSVTVVDMTQPGAFTLISRTGYAGAGYTHQGWFTGDQAHFLVDDEGDEIRFGHNTRTYVWDMRDLDQPRLVGYHEHGSEAADHNLYVVGDLAYLSNYRAGLRIMQLGDLDQAQLIELGFFDTVPADDAAQFSGLWSVYPFYSSGVIVVSDIEQGLFILQPDLVDTDGDGIGNHADSDDDNDGVGDMEEIARGRNPLINEPLVLLLLSPDGY